jgi:hypothetical protein
MYIYRYIYIYIYAYIYIHIIYIYYIYLYIDLVGGEGHLSPEVDPAVSSAAKILFSKQGNYVQELLLDEAVRIADALSRSIVSSAVAAATQQPLVVGSLLLRSALIGGSASLIPKQLQSITSSLGKISGPLFPFAIAAQELEGVFSLSPEDISALRTLKRLLQILVCLYGSLYINKYIYSTFVDI